MSESLSSTPSPTPASITPERAPVAETEIQDLRALVRKLQSSLIAITWIVGVFIFIQFWRAKGELDVVRPQAAQIIEAAKKSDAPINQFVSQLMEYARTHPDFAQILSKYPIQAPAAPATTPTTAPAPTAAPKPAGPAPAPAAAPKK